MQILIEVIKQTSNAGNAKFDNKWITMLFHPMGVLYKGQCKFSWCALMRGPPHHQSRGLYIRNPPMTAMIPWGFHPSEWTRMLDRL